MSPHSFSKIWQIRVVMHEQGTDSQCTWFLCRSSLINYKINFLHCLFSYHFELPHLWNVLIQSSSIVYGRSRFVFVAFSIVFVVPSASLIALFYCLAVIWSMLLLCPNGSCRSAGSPTAASVTSWRFVRLTFPLAEYCLLPESLIWLKRSSMASFYLSSWHLRYLILLGDWVKGNYVQVYMF